MGDCRKWGGVVFGIILVTSVLECLVFLPISFTVFQFIMAPDIAFLISVGLCLVSMLACWLCKLKLGSFTYRSISIVVSILLACIVTAQVNLVTFLIAAICIFIFMRVKSDINSGRDLAIQITAAALFFNIPLAFITINSTLINSVKYSNAAIFISTIASVILLILKQTDESRKFGNNNMRIGTTQRNNNQIFAAVVIVILLAVSAIGQVSNIYKFIISMLAWLLKILGSIFTATNIELTPQKEQILDTVEKVKSAHPSIFDKIINVLSIIIFIALILLAIYIFTKTIIKLVKQIINWFRKGEKKVQRYYENGHIDEKHSLYNKNLSNMVKKLHDLAVDLFDRELPYNKLPNSIAKTRRLFKYFKSKAQQAGVQISKASTSEEICQGVSDKKPETEPFNKLLSKCYAAARYGEAAPLPQELLQLESKLLK